MSCCGTRHGQQPDKRQVVLPLNFSHGMVYIKVRGTRIRQPERSPYGRTTMAQQYHRRTNPFCVATPLLRPAILLTPPDTPLAPPTHAADWKICGVGHLRGRHLLQPVKEGVHEDARPTRLDEGRANRSHRGPGSPLRPAAYDRLQGPSSRKKSTHVNRTHTRGG